MIFPIEIWEFIFSFCDPVDLIKFRSVCFDWNLCIPRILEKTDLWYHKCLKDIPESNRSVIAEKLLSHSDGVDFTNFAKDTKVWKSMYMSYMKWHRIQHYDAKIKRLSRPSSENITCITGQRNLLAVGSREGLICFYNLNVSLKQPIYIAEQEEAVSDLQFVENEQYTIAISTSFQGRIYFWNVDLGKFICKEHGSLISTSHDRCYIVNVRSLLVMGLVSPASYEFSIDAPRFVAITALKKDIYLWSEEGSSFRLALLDNELNAWSMSTFYVKPPKGAYLRYKMFKNCVATCICADGFLHISVNCNDWVKYNVFRHLQAVPVCVYFYNKVLILGLSSGAVGMYYVKDPVDLERMDFAASNAKIIQVSSHPIVSLDVIEHKCDQHLAVACNEYAYIIKLR